MADDDGQNIVAGRIRQQLMVKTPDYLRPFKWFACKCKFSRYKTRFYCTRCHSWAEEETKAPAAEEVSQ